jgi:peptidoglycan hydrolase-like protein with peptidoglycan-binding domain
MVVYKRGSKGEIVKQIQKALNLYPDGIFGILTEEAVKEFQQDHGLDCDGVVGKKTWDALEQQGTNLYTVTVPHLTKFAAESLLKQYSGAAMREEA